MRMAAADSFNMPGFGSESPIGLAALRIAVAVGVLISGELWQAARWAQLPAALRIAPEGLGWALGVVPIDVALARVAQLMLGAAALAALVGVGGRLAMCVVTVAGLYVFGLAELSGAVIHNMHLLWFAALLSVSPCADAWALRWPSGARHSAVPQRALAYGVPLQFARVLLGCVYFFPGFWKLATSGWAWVASDNLRNQLYWKWYELGAVPGLRVDRWPWLLNAAALGVVLFELGFIALIWTRTGRLWAALLGTLFHLSVLFLMGVSFVSLLLCYVVLIDWDGLTRARRPAEPAADSGVPIRHSWVAAAVVGALLSVAAIVQGARHAVDAWPFGCYPTFDRVVGEEIFDLRIEIVNRADVAEAVPDGPSTHGAPRTPQDWARAWQLAGLYGQPASPERLRAYFQQLARDPMVAAQARAGRSLRFYVAAYSVVPERWGEPPLRKRLLSEMRVP